MFERRALLASILTLLFVVLYIVFTRVTRITKVVLWVPMTFIRLIENAIHMVIWNVCCSIYVTFFVYGIWVLHNLRKLFLN